MRESLERADVFDPVRARTLLLRNFEARYTRHICSDASRVGFVVVRPTRFGHLLEHLCVHPDHQGRGFGSATLTLIQTEADAQARVLVVGALRGSPSNTFYLRRGFALLEQTAMDNYYARQPRGLL